MIGAPGIMEHRRCIVISITEGDTMCIQTGLL